MTEKGLSRRSFILQGLALGALGTAVAPAAWARLRPTESNILGPYYRKGAPVSTRLAGAGEPGTSLRIQGRVLDVDGKPLAGALVDVWQANAAGQYDNSDRAHPPSPDAYHLRARMPANTHGAYAFETILPGRYLNGNRFRPRHIHYIVSHSGFDPLTTQLYFRGDPYIKGDPFVKASLIIDLKPAGHKGGPLSGVFDIVLARPGQVGILLPTPSSA